MADKIIKSFTEEKTEAISTSNVPMGKLIASLVDIVKKNKFVDDTQKALFDNFENTKRVNVYIDDLDRGWEGRKEDIRRISALLNAVRDISNEMDNVHFMISLRSDVYYLVRTSDESTDKISGSVIWYTWDRHQILALLAKRVETFFGRDISENSLMGMHQSKIAQYLDPIMTQHFEGKGKWENAPIYRILMSLIRNRPRDLVMICTLAARNARKKGRSKILTEDLQSIFEDYSLERIQDIENEFKSELPEIRRLLFALKPSAKKSSKFSDLYVYTTDQVEAKIQSASANAPFYFSNNNKQATSEELHYFLYKINFLTARRKNKDDVLVRKTFEENKYLTGRFVDFGFGWEVHPAYRWALEPDDSESIYARLDLLDFE
ncbi:P-loop ATPase, Sll1717 family [Oleidesulfovibrio alaskensis]|uniref:P-loop ATPase, Sll1717 family n=1 Tax=Oleidesulfovibrio alaskensis TaxID=58180 RepID=UPI003B5BE842